MSRKSGITLFLAVAVLALVAGGALAADSPSKRVGLVIAFPDGSEHIEIVTVPAAASTFDVLEAADIQLASADSGFGPAICGINNVGCPASDCFCDALHFWAYYHLDPATNQWTSAATGVSGYQPADGEVEGLAWSGFDDNFNPTVQPPVYTFAQILAETSPAPDQAPEPVAVPEPATLLLVGGGLAGLVAYFRRARR